jgi:LuxR family quorum-sensing system transcriptional regulator CciR
VQRPVGVAAASQSEGDGSGSFAKGVIGLGSFQDVQSFVRAVRTAPTLTDIGLVLKDATRSFRFDHFALAQKLGTGAQLGPKLGTLRLTDFPDAWVDRLVGQGRVADDPVLLASERRVTPFAWSSLPAFMTMTSRHQAFMAEARAAGLSEGYTVPIHVPGQASGLVSFVMAKGGELPSESLPAAQYLACFAFEAARRLKLVASGGSEQAPRLTQRQLDCLVLAARGKSNWVAGQLLGLSEGTVHKYLEAAKQRYGVSTRTELVVRALYDGQLAFDDVLDADSARAIPPQDTGDAKGDRRKSG